MKHGNGRGVLLVLVLNICRDTYIHIYRSISIDIATHLDIGYVLFLDIVEKVKHTHCAPSASFQHVEIRKYTDIKTYSVLPMCVCVCVDPQFATKIREIHG